jgi:hypothetical protein
MLVGLASPAVAEGIGLDSVLFGDTRLRYEFANEAASPLRANGLTQSLRLGIETSFRSRLSAIVEGESVLGIVNDFDDGTGNNPDRPVILDPNSFELNRAQITARFADQAFLTVGRQSLVIDDQRFIGTLAFRQNSQTFDGASIAWRTSGGSTFQAAYINRVNRALGADNPAGRFRGDSYILNANVPTPFGRFGVFHYALDLETGPEDALQNTNSSKTSGARYDGRWHRQEFGLDVEASYARQRDFANSPFEYSADYWLIGARAFAGPVSASFRAESLGAGDGQSFQTPLATLHKFQGEADIFLVTPIDGVQDLEVSAQWNIFDIGPFKGIKTGASFHWFDAERGGANYGTEIDLSLRAKIAEADISFVYANYRAESFGTDTQRTFLSISKRF